MKFCYLEYHSTKCGSNLQTYKDAAPHNLGLQISGISRQQILFMLVTVGAQYSHLHQVLLLFLFYHPYPLWLYHCCWPMVPSLIFRSQSFFRFQTQSQTNTEIRWRICCCQIRWSEKWTWLHCLWCCDKARKKLTSTWRHEVT